ncbi:MAG TPA: helix-turn-helix transcriptional regulator [Gammaproteobacteria bacterium]|jgi:transcriptional regulator with XRE-family HTH domain|nr:helix-turn-helix transcriptional regulator [Gammaproteobacteria bacterium]
MSFRSLREQRLLSQAGLAELSGLSLRTIQRAEAGHRVSYASLRALAAAFAMDVDDLERKLYAMQPSADEFIEIPRWVRLWTRAYWHGGFRPSRRQAHFAEALCMGGGVAFLLVSFLVHGGGLPTVFRVAAGVHFVAGYALSLTIRVVDAYRLWPATEIPAWQWRPVRTLRGTAFDYGFVLLVLAAFFSIVFAMTR